MRLISALAFGCGVGCGVAPVDRGGDLGPAFRLSGPIDAGVEVSGDRTRAAVAWAWDLDGEVDGAVVEAPFEPLVYRYALDVPPPPTPDTGPVASGWAVGLPVLIEPDGDVRPEASVDPEALFAWVDGETDDATSIVTANGGRLAAVTRDHLLVLATGDRAPPCVDGAVPGLAPYRSLGPDCAGWEPLAEAGTRTEYQGIPMGRAQPP